MGKEVKKKEVDFLSVCCCYVGMWMLLVLYVVGKLVKGLFVCVVFFVY